MEKGTNKEEKIKSRERIKERDTTTKRSMKDGQNKNSNKSNARVRKIRRLLIWSNATTEPDSIPNPFSLVRGV